MPSYPPPQYESIFGQGPVAARPARPAQASTIFQRTHAFQVDTTASDPPQRLSEFVPFCSTKDRFGSCRPLRMRHADAVGDVEVRGCGCHARMKTEHGGTLQWRHAGDAEKKLSGASGLLVLDLITTGAVTGQDKRRTVAYSDWRLLVDLRGWQATKKEAQQMEVLVTASCLSLQHSQQL